MDLDREAAQRQRDPPGPDPQLERRPAARDARQEAGRRVLVGRNERPVEDVGDPLAVRGGLEARRRRCTSAGLGC